MSEPEYTYVKGKGWIIVHGRKLTYNDFCTKAPKGGYLYDNWVCLHCKHMLAGFHASNSTNPMLCKSGDEVTTTEGLFVEP